MKRLLVFLAMLSLVFMMSCGDSGSSGKKQGELYGACYPNKTCNEGLVCDEENDVCLPDGNDSDADDDIVISDIDIPDDDPDDHDNSEEPDNTEKQDDNPEEPDDTEKPDENPEEPEDNDIPETPDETPDNDTPVNPEATEKHKISGSVQAGSAASVALYECGKTEEIASADTDAKGKFSFKADISAAKTYCVKAGDFASCFKGMSDHTANISEITTAAYLLDKTCADLRKSETKIRTYAKLGTGEWLGELDYSKLSGIAEGLKLLASFIGSSDAKTLSEKIAEDAKKETPEFAKFFNGFRVVSDKAEIVIGETADSSANFSVEGGSTKVASGFKITWTLKNKSAEAATYKFTTSNPGEYVARAKLTAGNDTLSQDSSTVLFLQKKNGGTVYVSDTSKNISFRIDDGIYGVIPKGTVVKKGGSKINSISYTVLSAGGNQVSRLEFGPAGAVFEGDTMYFVHELGTVFGGDPQVLSAKRTNANGTVDVLNSAAGDPIMMAAAGDPIMTTAAGDPIMTAAAGDPIMTSAAGDPIMNSAAGDPIMSASAGDPIMSSAAGDPIMTAAAGDPIMMGTSSSTMISQTGHYSTFTVEAASLPVSVDALVARWCDGSFYRGYSPIEFIKLGFQTYKPESTLLPYLTCEKFGDLGNDLYELMNKQIGYQRNLNLFENLFFVSEFYNRMNAKRESGAVAAVKNGLELRSAIAALYTATTSYNRSSNLADMFDSSMIPLTYSGTTPEDYTSKAKSAVTGNSDSGDRYTATKKEMMIFANYITTSSKGPDFNSVSAVLNPDQLVCAWFNPDTPAQNCNKVYTINDAGHVTLGGTEVSVAEANAIFTKFFMPMNSRLGDSEKLDLFRTFYLALKYAGTIFYNGSDIEELNNSLLKTAYLVFDGIEGNANAVSIVDSFDASAHTVSVLDGNEMATRPYVQKLSTLTDQISLKVASESADVEKVLINIEGKEFEKVQENTRTYYKQTGDLKEKSIVLTPGSLSGTTSLETLLDSENVDTLGNITGRMTIVANSKISGKTYSTQKTYDFFVNDDGDGVNSKEVPADLQIFVNDSTGHAIPEEANPAIILNPGNKVYYPVNGVVSIENLTPAAYTVDAYADGYYAKSTSVNVPAGANFSVEIRLDEELTSTADASLELNVKIDTAKHPSKVYIQIYNDDMDLVANETAKFNDASNTYNKVNVEINSGRYTLLAVGEEMYNYLEAITLYEGTNSKEIKVVAKNACGNGIVDSAEECEPALAAPVSCGTIYPASTYPEKTATCNPDTCTFDKQECGKAAYCGDGIIDAPSEGCDGGAKDCSEIAGFGNSKGTAPCASDCSGYITANNCTKTTASCGSLPANAQWNDGEGTFAQTYDGTNWIPAAKNAQYGTTKEECTFSCTKGYKWNGSSCEQYPLSLGLICTGETGYFDTENETECPAYGEAFFGQDAQYAETGFCTPHKFTTSGSGDKKIVTDAYTHYEWTAAASENAMNWDAADDYCLHIDNESGSSAVWRLPSPAELLTIVDADNASPALDSSYFTTYGHTFWAKEDAKVSGNAWRIDENGALASVAKTENYHVLCVRIHDYDAPENRFTAENETVKDSVSGLMWQKQPVASRTWAEALNYCEEVATSDKFDWRLPNRNELASLINYEKASGAASDFPAIAAKGFWTSTTDISSAANAWTVDFATGSISSTEKTSTKYIICVRNDEPCFGDECPNACGFDQCRNMDNSTGLCTANGYGFTCGCKSGFNWNHAKCLLDVTRYTACTNLPDNAVWNTVFGISQTYDGDNWYPSEVGSFNKIASSTECRFVCATNYKWDAEEERCLPVSRVTNCSDKTPYSDWNVVSKISQTWDGENWIPSATSVYNTESSEEECRFVCKEHYTWDSENKICAAETQPATCTGLPANAEWHYATIEQTWNGTAWAPTTNGTHSTGAIENECHFRCIDEGGKYEWKNGACSAKPRTAQCAGLPDNAEWTGGYSSITQTWNGSEWFPGNTGSYNTEANSSYCRFKCLANYNWNGTSCEAATQIANCTGLLQNAQWNTVSSIKQTFINGNWVPSTTATYQEEASENECHFKCKEHYEWQGGECKAGTKPSNACTGLPANAQWVGNTTVEQIWNGTEWTPSTEGHHQSVSNDGCVFTCKANYNWTNGECKAATQSGTCTGLPANADWKGSNSIQQTWNGSGWLPSTNGSYSENAVANECRFACKAHYIWDGVKCNAETNIASCGNLPSHALWNTVSKITQTWNGSKFMPEASLSFNETPSTDECHFKCDTNYYWKNDNECAPQERTKQNCTGLPANAQWWNNVSTITQTWDGNDWTPSTAGIHATGGTANQCRFKCIDEGDKYKWENNACVANTKTGQNCVGLPANAHWNQYSQISQTWSGESWLPSTTGSYSETADKDRCYFTCDENYEWDGSTCVGATRSANCAELPDHALYNTVSTITQTYNGTVYVPATALSYCDSPSTERCCFKCDTNYELSDDQTSCRPATRLRDCTDLPANAQWNTLTADGQITQTWNGSEWAPDLTGTFVGQDVPAANSCIFTCKENYEWKNGLCTAKKETAQCKGLPANAMWNEVASIIREWQGSAWDLSTKGEYNEEPSKTECRYKCKENYTWDGSKCRADTRIADCLERPDHAVWNETASITQTWNGKEWLPKLESEYSYSPSNTECKYICDTGYYHVDGRCVANPCNIEGHNPCSDVEHSTGVCETADNVFLPYTCECEAGYNWWGKTGCRRKGIALGNICTGLDRCYDNDTEIVCPSEGEYFYGQDSQYAEKGYCAPKKFTVKETIVAAETHTTVFDENTKLEWLYDLSELGTWYEAVGYCDNLNYAGHSDWRLPSIKEMLTLVAYNRGWGIPLEFDGSSWQYGAWSSTDDPIDSDKVLIFYGNRVDLMEDYVWDGYAEYHTKASDNKSYICVRGSGLSESSFEEIDANGDGTEILIKDTTTNLYWQKNTSYKNWRQAFTYCENLVYGGYDDWRMPNINELYSIVDYTVYDPAMNPLFEINYYDDYSESISSTTIVDRTDYYYGVRSSHGNTTNYSKSDGNVRCVRSDLCDEGTFWDGKNCAVSPCDEDSCTIEHSDGTCIPKSSSKFECGCADGYRWNDSSASCVKDQCLDSSLKNKCASMRGSDGVCTRIGETDFTCGCTEGYFWSISSCRKKAALGSICTGLDRCYNYDGEITCPEEGENFYGQDANYAAKGACAPKSFRNAEIDGDAVVIDNNTGIMWQKYASAETYSFNNAIGYCADLEYAGYTDWRLPNPPELISILEFGENAPIDTDYFPEAATYRMWGSASNPTSKSDAFDVYLSAGNNPLAGYDHKTNKYKVRCVRGDAMKSNLATWTAENGEEVLVETESGLMLNPDTTFNGKIFDEELDYCENYEYAGYTDWRMANLYETLAFVDFPQMSFPFGTSTVNRFYPGEIFSADYSFNIYRSDIASAVGGLCVRSGNVPADFQIDGEQLNMTCGEIFECINNKCLDGSLECIENCISRSTKNAKYQYQDLQQCYDNHSECSESENPANCKLSACTAELEACFANSGEGPHCMSNYNLCYSTESVDTNKTCIDLIQCSDSCGNDRGCELACEYYSTPEARGDYDNMSYYRDYECAGAADSEGCMIAHDPEGYEKCYGEPDKTCGELSDCLGQCYGDPYQEACEQSCRESAAPAVNARYDAAIQCVSDNNCVYDKDNPNDYTECIQSYCFVEVGSCFPHTSYNYGCGDLDFCLNYCNGDQTCEQNCHIKATWEAENQHTDLLRCYDNYQDFCMNEESPEECLRNTCRTEYESCYDN
ncbi:DUF1566 domain-containing protein [bacterium]|nr:DUF1566 domain-containing protein [bacterium]